MLHQDIKVSIIGANSLSCEGLRRILNEEEFDVCHSFEDTAPLLSDTKRASGIEECGIILFETADPHVEGEIAALRERFPNSRLVFLANRFEFDSMAGLFRAGADGYIIKDIQCESLIESLRLVALGEKVMPSQLVKHLPLRSAFSTAHQHQGSEELENLSDREIETLRCLIMGYPNKVIAYRLDISEATVKVHVKAILRKLQVQNRTQAAIWAVNNGLDASAACATLAASSTGEQAHGEDLHQPLAVGT